MKKIPVRHIKSSIKEPDASGGFIIWSLDELLAGKDMVQELHRHSFYFILILEKGTGEHIIDFISYPIIDRSIFIMRPGQVHELILKKDSKGFLLEFPADFYSHSDTITKQILKKVSQKNYSLSDTKSSKKLLSLMKTILQEASDKKKKYEYALQINLQLLLVELLRQEYSYIDVPDVNSIYLQEHLEEFQELIADNISNHKQVSWYAEKMHMTSYQLNAITKATLGKTSLALITDYILLEAKRYLLATSNQINQIAWHLGYEDVSYFIRFFKKHTGYSPEVFRNNFK
jgi:AraC family transcriptional regulator, transcriptional activator of pobA